MKLLALNVEVEVLIYLVIAALLADFIIKTILFIKPGKNKPTINLSNNSTGHRNPPPPKDNGNWVDAPEWNQLPKNSATTNITATNITHGNKSITKNTYTFTEGE